MSERYRCRFCDRELDDVILDLGLSPLSNALVRPEDVDEPETFLPLRVQRCDGCGLVQLPEYASAAAIFSDYAYFSSFSSTWVAHGRALAHDLVAREKLDGSSLVVELASNDGCLLEHFARAGVRVHGVEPAANVARAAVDRGIPTTVEFFGAALARRLCAELGRADVVVANNVLAHVPALNDFVAGIRVLLAERGVATIEFPHLLRTVEHGEFDTFYHEHFSYFSLTVAEKVLAAHALRVAGVEELSTHGGSLRLSVRHGKNEEPVRSVEAIKALERAAQLDAHEGFVPLARSARRTKRDLLELFIGAERGGKRVAGYGAPAKATTLLNYCGIRTDLLGFTVDKSPRKQGRFIPGVRIPIEAPQRLTEVKPDLVLILPWNIADEIVEEMAVVRSWGGRFVVPIPELQER
ncbi:MAG TPA: class I SAM-dependent methyltransferase [Candidatus Eremiobacteraceae bacterium]|nr:class I SAM-dependent methyltransferase [Candidatus Eremiobacteraceae bacterium]